MSIFRRRALWFFLAGVIVATVAYLYVTRDPYRNVPVVTLPRLNQAEADWYAAQIEHYLVDVEVRFSSEHRLYVLEVRNQSPVTAQVATWDEGQSQWGGYETLDLEDAEFFTVGGLFRLVRSDLINEDVQREVQRLAVAQDHPYPSTIFLGKIFQDGAAVGGTELIIEVVSFRILE